MYMFLEEMYLPAIQEEWVQGKLSLPSVLLRGMLHQEKFSVDIGVTRPEGQYVYRAAKVDASIRPPYRLIRIDDKSTTTITPQHLDGMIAEIIRHYFDEDLRPLRLAGDLNPAVYERLYQHLVRPALPPGRL